MSDDKAAALGQIKIRIKNAEHQQALMKEALQELYDQRAHLECPFEPGQLIVHRDTGVQAEVLGIEGCHVGYSVEIRKFRNNGQPYAVTNTVEEWSVSRWKVVRELQD